MRLLPSRSAKTLQTAITTVLTVAAILLAACNLRLEPVAAQIDNTAPYVAMLPGPAPPPGRLPVVPMPAPAPPPKPSWLVEHSPSHTIRPHRAWEVRPGIELREGYYHGAHYHLVCVDRAQAHVRIAPYKTTWTGGEKLTHMDVDTRSIVTLNGTFFEPKRPGARIYGEVKNELQAYRVPLIKRRTYWAVTREGRFEMDESPPCGRNAKGRMCYEIPLERWNRFTSVLGGGGRLLRDGRPASIGAGYNDEGFRPDVLRKTNRSAIGWSRGQRFMYLVAADQPGWTPQATAEFLRDAGAWQGMLLDGGGSSELVVKDHVRNKCEFGKERLLSTAVVVSKL
jgi:hypothetical protein